MCYHWTKPPAEPGLMTLEEARSVVSSLKEFGDDSIKIQVTGGEPLMNPMCLDLIRFISDQGFRSVITTNGCLIDEKTARRYRRQGKLPSELDTDHTWKTRKDPFEEVWHEIKSMLEINAGLEAKPYSRTYSAGIRASLLMGSFAPYSVALKCGGHRKVRQRRYFLARFTTLAS